MRSLLDAEGTGDVQQGEEKILGYKGAALKYLRGCLVEEETCLSGRHRWKSWNPGVRGAGRNGFVPVPDGEGFLTMSSPVLKHRWATGRLMQSRCGVRRPLEPLPTLGFTIFYVGVHNFREWTFF